MVEKRPPLARLPGEPTWCEAPRPRGVDSGGCKEGKGVIMHNAGGKCNAVP